MRRLAALLLLAACPAAAASFPGCPGCNVILVSITNVSANRMSLYGYGRDTTPGLRRWADANALVFDEAFAHASWTLPEAVSMMTSLYPYAHRVWKRSLANSLDGGVKTLPEILRERGYATAAFTGGLDYSPTFNYLRGFQTAPRNRNFTPLSTTLEQASRWLARRDARPFFLLVQGYDAHCPFQPDAGRKGRFSAPWESGHSVDAARCVRGFKNEEGSGYRAFYAGGCPEFHRTGRCADELGQAVALTGADVEYLGALYDEVLLGIDARLSAFLESLDPELLAKTIVVVTSDHGEMFAKHGRFGRAGTRRGTHYDDVLHVPLLVRFPRGPRGRVRQLVQHVDLMPTLLDELGLEKPAGLQGRSLMPAIFESRAVNEYAFSGVPYNLFDTSDPAKLAMLEKTFRYWSVTETARSRRWKLIHERLYDAEDAGARERKLAGETYELYDLARDPEELSDVSASRPEALARMKAALAGWSDGLLSGSPLSLKSDRIPEAILRKARERGYWQ